MAFDPERKEIGPVSGHDLMGQARTGTYVGPEARLTGERARIYNVARQGSKVAVQFNDADSTGMGYGWWLFDRKDFRLDEKINWDEPA